KTYANARKDHTIVLKDLATDQVRAQMTGHERTIISLCFNRDGTLLATGSNDRTLRVWDTRTGQQLHVLRGCQGPAGISAFRQDGSQIATLEPGDERVIRVWDVATGRQIASCVHEQNATGATFSPQGDQLASVEHYPSNVIRLWDLPTARLLKVMPGHRN